MVTPAYVVGAGGHAKVVIATLRAAGHEILGILDDADERQGQAVLGCPVIGKTEQLATVGEQGGVVIAIGNNRVRQGIAARFPWVRWLTVIHPAATVHDSVRLDEGTVVFAGAVIQPEVKLGAHTIVNTGALIDHDCVLEPFVHVAPGCRLAGNVRVGTGAFLGTGVCVIPGRYIGPWSTVGAGAVVINDLAGGVTAVGVPARKLPREDVK